MKFMTDVVARCSVAVCRYGREFPNMTPLLRRLSAAAVLCSLAFSASAAEVLIRGIVKREVFPNQTRPAVESNTAGAPSVVEYLNIFEVPTNYSDNYAQRVS